MFLINIMITCFTEYELMVLN